MNRQSIFENGDTVLNLRTIFRQLHNNRLHGTVMENSSLLSENLLDYLDSCLDRFVLKDRLFLNPDISIPFLADKIHTNRTYISLAIHNLYGVKFSEFVSFLRIEYSKKLLKIFKLDLEHVASACGYMYASQFTKKFTEVEGMNPSTWRHFVAQSTEK